MNVDKVYEKKFAKYVESIKKQIVDIFSKHNFEEMYPSYDLYALVDYVNEEPKFIVDDYNECGPIEGLTDTYVITFEKVDGSYNGTKLLGSPSDYIDEYDDKPPLLLQYDPYEFDVPFLAFLDG